MGRYLRRLRDATASSGRAAPDDETFADSLTRGSPFRFTVHVARCDGDTAVSSLADHDRVGHLSLARNDVGETCRLHVVSELDHAMLARARVLWTLHHAGVDCLGYDWHDTVANVSDRWLRSIVDAWAAPGGNLGPARRQIEALTGHAVLERLLAWAADSEADASWRRSAAFGAQNVMLNSPLDQVGMGLTLSTVSVVASRPQRDEASIAGWLLNGVRDRAALGMFGLPSVIEESAILPLVSHGTWQVSGVALEILSMLPGPRSDAAAEVLLALAVPAATSTKDRGVHASQVASALGSCEDRPQIREALRRFLGHPDPETRSTAASALAAFGGRDEAAQLWTRLFATRSHHDHIEAEHLLCRYGDARDIDAVAGRLRTLLKQTKGVQYSPPRASYLITFLVNHGVHPAATTTLEQVTSRFDRLDADLQEWIREHQPDLAPRA